MPHCDAHPPAREEQNGKTVPAPVLSLFPPSCDSRNPGRSWRGPGSLPQPATHRVRAVGGSEPLSRPAPAARAGSSVCKPRAGCPRGRLRLGAQLPANQALLMPGKCRALQEGAARCLQQASLDALSGAGFSQFRYGAQPSHLQTLGSWPDWSPTSMFLGCSCLGRCSAS